MDRGQRTDDDDNDDDWDRRGRTDRGRTMTTERTTRRTDEQRTRTAITGHDGTNGQRTDDDDGMGDGMGDGTDGLRTTTATAGRTQRDGRYVYINI